MKHKHHWHEVEFIGSISDDDPIKCASSISQFIRDYRKTMCCICGIVTQEGSEK